MKVEPRQPRFNEIAGRFEDDGIVNRHPKRTLANFKHTFGITEENAEEHVDTLFHHTIQNRSGNLATERFRQTAEKFDVDHFLGLDAWEDGFHYLLDIENVGPKIANEFLRKIVHVYGIHEEWRDDLHVPLDTHVVQALVKTDALDLGGRDWEEDFNGSYQRLVNTTPSREVSPRKRVSYYELQDAFEEAANQHGFERIVFDELWIEHKHYLNDPFMQQESCLFDLLRPEFRN